MAQAVLAVQLGSAGILKVTSDPAMVEMFTTIGAGQWLRYTVGVLEIAAAIGLLVPRLCGPAALGVTALMTGAALTNIFVIAAPPWLPIGLLIVSAMIAWARRTAGLQVDGVAQCRPAVAHALAVGRPGLPEPLRTVDPADHGGPGPGCGAGAGGGAGGRGGRDRVEGGPTARSPGGSPNPARQGMRKAASTGCTRRS
ncbi:DoxX family protein [Nonomuraea jabiensis]|uniref:Putative membrane protein n=1 Tax=Nonomuraea jabiensis TaxID=882448 RepID=A0A7W9GGQ4_9ACTN|nr:DoxX family protein [Nonomuraea jabiensis]MBB5783391.1 putative membrane protein [Nonomuraea jabiensis]